MPNIERAAIEVACAVCGRPRRVPRSVLARGLVRYCSRRCYVQAVRARRVLLRCQQCRTRFAVPRSQGDRKYCSRRCVLLAWAPRRLTCLVCGTAFDSRPWRHAKFCSLACANRGRQRIRQPGNVARNAVVLELHERGLKAPAITAELAARDWVLSPVGVRTVISRGRACRGGPLRVRPPLG